MHVVKQIEATSRKIIEYSSKLITLFSQSHLTVHQEKYRLIKQKINQYLKKYSDLADLFFKIYPLETHADEHKKLKIIHQHVEATLEHVKSSRRIQSQRAQILCELYSIADCNSSTANASSTQHSRDNGVKLHTIAFGSKQDAKPSVVHIPRARSSITSYTCATIDTTTEGQTTSAEQPRTDSETDGSQSFSPIVVI